MKDANRRLIGRSANLVTRERVFETPEAVEIEASEHYEIARRRVFFDDVVLVTLHRERGVIYLVTMGLLALMFLVFGMFFMYMNRNPSEVAVTWVFFAFASPFIIAFLTRLIFGVDVVTVFGRRSKAAIRFSFRKQRARELYGHLCATIRNAQRRREQEYAAAAAENAPPPALTPEAEFPMPPPEELPPV